MAQEGTTIHDQDLRDHPSPVTLGEDTPPSQHIIEDLGKEDLVYVFMGGTLGGQGVYRCSLCGALVAEGLSQTIHTGWHLPKVD